MLPTKRPGIGTLLRWLAIAMLFALPTFARYEFSDAATWVCRRDGTRAGQCYGEPTLYHRLGFSEVWSPDQPRIETIQIVALEDLGDARAESGGEYLHIAASDACWQRWGRSFSWCYGDGMGAWHVPAAGDGTSPVLVDAQDLARRFNDFRSDPRQLAFAHRRPAPTRPWHILVYVIASLGAFLTVRRSHAIRTRAWLRVVAATPATPTGSPYRGRV